MSVKFEILMPVYNCESTIQRTLQSILNQTIDKNDMFLTIVNNNSSDKTLNKIVLFFEQNEGFNNYRILHETEKGIVPALNHGLFYGGLEDYNWIARIDADDRWYPDKLEKQKQFILENPDISIVGTQIMPVDHEDFEPIRNSFVERPKTDKEIKEWLFSSRNPIAHPSVVYSKKILLRTGGYDDLYPIAEDYTLWLKAAKWYKFANLNEICIDYTIKHNPNYNAKVPQIASQLYKILYKQIA